MKTKASSEPVGVLFRMILCPSRPSSLDQSAPCTENFSSLLVALLSILAPITHGIILKFMWMAFQQAETRRGQPGTKAQSPRRASLSEWSKCTMFLLQICPPGPTLASFYPQSCQPQCEIPSTSDLSSTDLSSPSSPLITHQILMALIAFLFHMCIY